MRDYNVFIGEDFTTSQLTTVVLLLAQPTCGKTSLAANAKSGNFIIDEDDILHVVKKCRNLSGWDLLNKICFDCNYGEDFDELRKRTDQDEEVINLVADFSTLLKDVIKACVSMARTDMSQLTLLIHHHSLYEWTIYALNMAKTELRSWHPTILSLVYYRRSAKDYITEWKLRQQREGSMKSKSFTDDELKDSYDKWIKQIQPLLDTPCGNGNTTMKIVAFPLSVGEYLSDHYGDSEELTESDIWDIDCDIHRYQVMCVENILLQKAFGNCLSHDLDKYGYGSLDKWLTFGLEKHRSHDAPSHHHKENVYTIVDLVEMVSDWISASHRRLNNPWINTLQGCTWEFDTNQLIYNTFIEFNKLEVWPYIWLISQLTHHYFFNNHYISDDFKEHFPYDCITKILDKAREE